MTQEVYNELVNKRIITNTKMTLKYINEHKLELKDIITVPAILAMYLGKEEIVEDNIVVDENDIIEINEVNPPTDETIVDSVIIVSNDNDETLEVEHSEISDENIVDMQNSTENDNNLIEESTHVEKVSVKEKSKTKKK